MDSIANPRPTITVPTSPSLNALTFELGYLPFCYEVDTLNPSYVIDQELINKFWDHAIETLYLQDQITIIEPGAEDLGNYARLVDLDDLLGTAVALKEATDFETKRYWIEKKLKASCRPGDGMDVDRFDTNGCVLVFAERARTVAHEETGVSTPTRIVVVGGIEERAAKRRRVS